MPEPISAFALTAHARFEMERRGLDEPIVRSVLADSGQRIAIRAGRDIRQSRLVLGGKEYLVNEP